MDVQQEEANEEEVIQRLSEMMAGNANSPDEKHNVHTFLFNVSKADDTTKVGNLRDDKELNELGVPKLPVRSYKEMALISEKIMGNEWFSNYFKDAAEIVTSTSLSRTGFLTNLAVVQRREVADVTKRRVQVNKGWFKGKKKEGEEQNE